MKKHDRNRAFRTRREEADPDGVADARKHFPEKRKQKYSSDEVAKVLAGAKRLGDKLLKARVIDPVKWRRPFTI